MDGGVRDLPWGEAVWLLSGVEVRRLQLEERVVAWLEPSWLDIYR